MFLFVLLLSSEISFAKSETLQIGMFRFFRPNDLFPQRIELFFALNKHCLHYSQELGILLLLLLFNLKKKCTVGWFRNSECPWS